MSTLKSKSIVLFIFNIFLLGILLHGTAAASGVEIVVPCSNGTGDTQKLIEAILTTNQLPGQDTIRLGKDCRYRLFQAYDGNNGLPDITDDLIINGNGATIYRQPPPKLIANFRLLHAQAADRPIAVLLQDLTLANGKLTGGSGGAAYASGTTQEGGYVNLTLLNAELVNNHAGGGGGAVFIVSDSVAVLDTKFEDNSAGGSGGGLLWFGLDDNSILFVAGDSAFVHNEADEGGGLYAAGNANIEDAQFSENKAGDKGGGLTLFDSLEANLTKVHFTGNEAQSAGGGVYMIGKSLSISSSNFFNNKGEDGGGLQWIGYKPDSLLQILGESQFVDNEGELGGGLYASGKLVMVKTVLLENKAGDEGGGVFLRDGEDSQILNSLFQGNESAFFGGGMTSYRSEPVIEGSTFSANKAGTTGGALFINGTADLKRNIFTGNEAESSGAVTLILPNDISQEQWVSNNIWDGNRGDRVDDLYLMGDEESAQTTLITQNTFIGRRDGGEEALQIDRPLSAIEASNNIFHGYSLGIEVKRGMVKTNSNLYSAILEFEELGVQQSENNISDNPRFLDFDNSDYRLNETSPAVDAGMDNPQITQDIAADPRPQGDGYDIGAFESPFTASPPTTPTPSPTPSATPSPTPPPPGPGFDLYLPVVVGQD